MARFRDSRRIGRRLARALLWLSILGVAVPLGVVAAYRVVPPPMTPLMVIRLAEGESMERDWTSLAQISPHAVKAVIAAEDNLFCSHRGFDWDALMQALAEHRRGERLRGASTISMQTAKNVFLWPGRSLFRKGLEAYLTPLIELAWGKRRIIEIYLNVAEWGRGIYGIEAAAQRHFGKRAARLSRWEAALLAAVLPNPRAWSASNPGPFVRQRARVYLRRMEQLGPLLDCVT
ncbi:MAG: monofunctional biosynthetic peptidoglycan transglycosylase [Kiloniellales bacterium]|nr:monofunctional biosynthetic peptidoglycan transglycosylase [Kiloniellales bacterium]MDJ0968792.1 monofunctional biosynthetic peptidoglycan transglycosylase [Kiloniellales bacterium]MDJ0982282.1 monofunctional biosynthetic peptidoglycan transglycosylase [Kiloniellales bacterium]